MVLDPATLVLLFFALIPRPGRGPVLAWLVRWRRWLGVPALAALAGMAVGRPPAPWPMLGVAAFNIWAFAVFCAWFGKPRRGGWALMGLAGLWSAQLFVIFLQTFFEPSGTAQVWFIDFFDKLFLVLVYPLLEAAGLQATAGAVLGYLAPAVSLLSNMLVGVHFCVSAGAAWLLYRLIGGQAGLPPAPDWLSSRLHPTLLAAAVVASGAAWATGGEAPALVVAAHKILAAVLCLRGAALLQRALGRGHWQRAAWVAALVAAVLHRELLLILVGLAVLDGLVGLGPALAEQRGRARLAVDHADELLAGWRRAFGPVTVLAVLLPVVAMPEVVNLGTAVAASPRVEIQSPPRLDARDADTHVQLATSSGTIATVDRYEFPNRRGALPTVGLGPQAAQSACAADGGRLCTSQEWYEACSDAGESFYVVRSAPYEPAAIRRLLEDCNVRHPDRVASLQPAGAMPRCRGRLHVHDLAGNAFEWVRLEGMPEGFWGLAGSYYRYSDAQTMSCGFRALVHEAQLGLVDIEGVGFRCCR